MNNRSSWRGIDHVQLAIPVGGEQVAREFYVGVLGLTEVPKPAALSVRGGAWFEAGTTRCHLDDPIGNRIELIEDAQGDRL